MNGEVLGLLKPGAPAAVDDFEQQGLILLVNVLLVIGVLGCLLFAPPAGGGSIFCRQRGSAVKQAVDVAGAQWERHPRRWWQPRLQAGQEQALAG